MSAVTKSSTPFSSSYIFSLIFQSFTTDVIGEALLIALDLPGKSQLQLSFGFPDTVPTYPASVS